MNKQSSFTFTYNISYGTTDEMNNAQTIEVHSQEEDEEDDEENRDENSDMWSKNNEANALSDIFMLLQANAITCAKSRELNHNINTRSEEKT